MTKIKKSVQFEANAVEIDERKLTGRHEPAKGYLVGELVSLNPGDFKIFELNDDHKLTVQVRDRGLYSGYITKSDGDICHYIQAGIVDGLLNNLEAKHLRLAKAPVAEVAAPAVTVPVGEGITVNINIQKAIEELCDLAKADKLPGGKADKKKPEDFDADKLAAGTKVEMEHTSDKEVAQEIAMDHLTEDDNYYEKLKDVEKCNYSMKKAEGEGSKGGKVIGHTPSGKPIYQSAVSSGADNLRVSGHDKTTLTSFIDKQKRILDSKESNSSKDKAAVALKAAHALLERLHTKKSETEDIDMKKSAPEGVSEAKYKRCKEDVKRQGGGKNPYAICAASLQRAMSTDEGKQKVAKVFDLMDVSNFMDKDKVRKAYDNLVTLLKSRTEHADEVARAMIDVITPDKYMFNMVPSKYDMAEPSKETEIVQFEETLKKSEWDHSEKLDQEMAEKASELTNSEKAIKLHLDRLFPKD